MNPIALVVEELLKNIQARYQIAQAIPDLAISLLESSIDDGDMPSEQAMRNIHHMIHWDGFPEEKKYQILGLLAKLHRGETLHGKR
jgi:hypothetical protein